MKSLSAKMLLLLNSVKSIRRADLFTITLTTGEILRYTTADYNITYNNNVYVKAAINRGKISQAVGLSVDDVDLEILVKPTITTAAGTSLAYAAQIGSFDAALVEIDTAFMPAWGDMSTGIINRFTGYADIDEVTGTSVKLKIKSITEKLNISIPKNIYSPSCGYALYSSACGVDREKFGVPMSVLSGSSNLVLLTAALKADHYFDLGFAVGITGVNSGVSRNIISQVGGTITLSCIMGNAPAVGDTFMCYPGCSGSLAACAVFNNLSNNRSFPYIPVPEVTA